MRENFTLLIVLKNCNNVSFVNSEWLGTSSEEEKIESQRIEALRRQIDHLDAELVALLSNRFRLTKEVGQYKHQNNIPPVDRKREGAQYKRIRQMASELGLDPGIAENVLKTIIQESVKNHEKLQNTDLL